VGKIFGDNIGVKIKNSDLGNQITPEYYCAEFPEQTEYVPFLLLFSIPQRSPSSLADNNIKPNTLITSL
jgi:hypothetical protein